MPQIIISSTDNDRLKTRKAQGMLSDLGALPADHRLRPNFLRGARLAGELIDRALANIQPVIFHHCRNSKTLINAANAKFASAFALPDGTLPLFVADFRAGTYQRGGATVTFGDLFVADADWGPFNPALLIPGTGLTDNGSSNCLRIAPSPEAALLSGFTAIAQFTNSASPTDGFGLSLLDLPNYATELDVGYGGFAVDVDDGQGNSAEGESLTLLSALQAAFNLSPDRLAASINARDLSAVDCAAHGPVNAVAFVVRHGLTLQSLAFYPLQAEADLPSLIETPILLTSPEISGTPQAGQVLTVSNGTWRNLPTEFHYEWSSQNQFDVGGDQNTYTPDEGDVGGIVSCNVIASNSHGEEFGGTQFFGPIIAA